MLNTMTHATFKYKGYTVYAKRLIDKITGKDFGWAGAVGNHDEYSIVAKSIQQFEKKFIQFCEDWEAKRQVSNVTDNGGDDDDERYWR